MFLVPRVDVKKEIQSLQGEMVEHFTSNNFITIEIVNISLVDNEISDKLLRFFIENKNFKGMTPVI